MEVVEVTKLGSQKLSMQQSQFVGNNWRLQGDGRGRLVKANLSPSNCGPTWTTMSTLTQISKGLHITEA